MPNYYDAEELAQASMANYPGGMAAAYGNAFDLYTGAGDIDLDYDGKPFGGGNAWMNQQFMLEGRLNRQFSIVITNTNAATRFARLTGGYNIYAIQGATAPSLVPGLVVTGAFNDTNGDIGLAGSTTNAIKTIEEFHGYILFNPTRVISLKMKSTLAEQIDEVLTIDSLTPFFGTTASEEIYPANQQNEYTFQDKTAVLGSDFQITNQTNMILPIVGLSSVTLTWFMGASYNTAASLSRKASLAIGNAAFGKGPAGMSTQQLSAASFSGGSVLTSPMV